MHMADALVSPAVGGTLWVATGGLAAYSARKLAQERDERKAPLMGVLGAFIFSAQMINFSIPATGSSGHLGGGMILAILLGPHAAFITIFSVLTVQALFFADGGLLALGCNVFNLGFFPCFIAYPLIYRRIVGAHPTSGRLFAGATLAGIVGLQLGALGVVLETVFSGISELPFTTFVLLMQPIHLAIGLVEGLVTFSVVTLVWKARPEILDSATQNQSLGDFSVKPVLVGLGVATILTAGIFSWFASGYLDGLEWSMAKTSGKEELEAPAQGVYAAAEKLQHATAILPDYDFKKSDSPENETEEGNGASVVNPGTSVAGLVGAVLTLILVGVFGVVLRKRGDLPSES